MAGERFNREAGKARLAEAPPADSAVDTEVEASELLTRLEQQAAESGRLEGQTQTLERALRGERDARRRLAETLKRERRAAKALHDRAEQDRAARAAAEEELERLRQGFAVSEQQLQMSWARLRQAEQELAEKARPQWRRLLRLPPGD
jgi:chromosome segregation ATPase